MLFKQLGASKVFKLPPLPKINVVKFSTPLAYISSIFKQLDKSKD